MATGLRDQLPDLTGLADRWAPDVLHCPYSSSPTTSSSAIAINAELVEDDVCRAVFAFEHGSPG